MKKRLLAGLLIAVMCLTMLPATAFAADGACDYCQSTGGHKDNCVYKCPTDNCTVTKQAAEDETVTYSHSQAACPYAEDPEMFCKECGYWEYRADEEDYWHRTGCSTGYPESGETVGEDGSPDPGKTDFSNINGVSYYGVDSDYFEDSTSLYIKDMLTAKSNQLDNDRIGKVQSISALWQYVALELQDEYGRGTKDGKFKRQFDGVLGRSLAFVTGSSGTYERSNARNGDNTYNVYSTGLTTDTYAGSVSAAAAAMETQIYDWYRASGGGRNAKYANDPSDGAVRKNTALSSDADPDDVYYMLIGAFKTSGTNKKGHYQALGVIFSDPTITAILPADDGSASTTTKSEPTMGTQEEASHVKNETNTTISAQQELTTTTSYEATSEINGSRQYGFEETVTAGYERDGILSGKISVEVSFTASQVIENGWSQSQSTAEEKSVAYSAGVELPPYTNVMIRQYGSKTTETTNYTCPVALNFTVTVVEYTIDPSDNNATCETRILGTFGANARADLNKRAVVESALKDGDGITWNDLYEDNADLKMIVQQLLSKYAPMASTGAKFVVVTNTTSSEITGLSPTLPLNRVKTIDDVQDYDLSTGDFLYVDNIQLEGLNAQNAPYYGFNQYLGHWTLVDENGQNLPEDSAVAQLETDPITKTTRLVAGTQTGTVYLKYLIGNDSKYNTASNPDVYATDDTLAATAVVRVNISDTTLAGGSVAVSGNLAIPVGDPSEAIESYLKTAIYDAEGKKVSRPVIWDQQELGSDGITVASNNISFTKEGTFHVRAIVGTGANQIKSDWYEVTALPARALNSIVIPDTAAFDRNGSSLNLSTLTVQYFDQYGDAWTSTTTDDLTWVCDNEGAVIKDNVLTVPSAGTYVVTAQTEDGIISNEMNVTVTDSAVTITEMKAEKTSLTSSGGEVEFTITGANLPEGITLTVQENNSITATTTGTDTEQKATLTFPANTDTSADVTYTVTNNQDDTKTVTITVAKASGSTGGSSGGSSSSTTYVPSVDAGHNGDVTVSPSRPSSGQTVTITVDPDAGYELDDLTVTDARGNVVKVTDNGDGTYSFTQPSSKVTIEATFAEIQDEPTLAFVDVPESDYYYDAVLWAVENGITNGTSATTFSPDANVSRAQMVTFLWRAAGSPEPQSSVNPFTDVSSSAYYYDAVLWAVENGITNGTSGTTFSPESAVSRAQAVTFLWRSASSPAASGVSFDDMADEAYYAQAVAWAAQAGITNGTGGNNFSPDLIVSRAQAVTFLYRHMG